MKFINKFKSPNFNSRNNSRIKFIIIHYTALKNSKTAIHFLCDRKNKVSSHFLISQNGSIYNLVEVKKRAWHAGNSSWINYKNINSYSIGIELDFSYEFKNNTYNSRMIVSLKKLLKYLIREYNLKNINILGHSDVAPFRKTDPGPNFPWYKLSLSNLVFYPSLKYEIYIPIFKSWFKKNNFENNKTKCIFILCCVGYDIKSAQKNKSKLKKILLAYQMHFIPSNISGRFDKITTKYLMRHYLNLILTKN